ncbi:hypothetical protein HQ576_20465 [bacterium]|nr:hypothetical protein [bacterium]
MLSGITGKNDVLASSCVAEFQFSSMGRFELESRTFAYVKADMGRSTTAVSNDYSLTETGKSWGITPAQWRGYSVLIYSGTGEGQLRGIVSNTANTMSVAKWLNAPDTTSRYFVCAPGPMVDRVDMASGGTSASDIIVGNNGAFLSDKKATWEDDQWNGYRVVVYRGAPGAGQLLPGSTARMIYSESIQPQTIQERIIADTVGGNATTPPYPRLVLSPELNEDTAGTHWSYMILGTHGTANHQAVVKAYDVVHQTSEAEFAAAGSATTHTVVGPNPDGVASTHSDGYLTVAAETIGKPDTVTDAFVLNFTDGNFDPEEGGTRVGAAGAITDVNAGGNLLLDGLHLPADGALHHLDYNVDAAVGLVTQNYDEGDPPPAESVPPPGTPLPPKDGGFVEFWFRPDVGCMEGTTERTLIRIVGKCEAADKHDDIRVQMVGTKLRVVVRSSGTAPYMRLKAGRTGDPLQQQYRLVKCREQNFVPADADSVSVDLSTWVNAYDPNAGMWKPGQWHRIGVGWYESVIIGAVNDDGDAYTDYRCDASPGLDTLDDMQVRGRVTLYVDGVRIADDSVPPKGYTEVNGFNLVPPETGGMIHIGEQGKPPAGTIDGVVAYAHTSAYAYFTMRTTTKIARYFYNAYPWSFDGSQATYQSPIIDLPGTAGKRVALGTARMSVVFPRIYSNVYWLGYRRFPATIAVALNGESTPHSPGITTDVGEPPGYYNEDGLCTSLPLRKDVSTVSELAGTNNLLWNETGTSLRYEVKLSAFHWAGTNVGQGFPRFWQAPFVEDVTISYFGPVVFLHWQ